MRKFVAVALAALMLICPLASCTSGGDPDAIGDYTPEVNYLITDAGTFYFKEALGDTAILTGYTGKATKDDKVVVPAIFNDRPVVGIGAEAFYHLSSVVSVAIPATVLDIGTYAFAECTELTEISFYDPATYDKEDLDKITRVSNTALLTIGKGAFENCAVLPEIDLGTALTEIGDHAFDGCVSFTEIALPETLETIGKAAFWGCKALSELVIPESVTSIGDLAFYECTGLESIKLHDNIDIGAFVFVTASSTLKDKIDMSNLTEDSKVYNYVSEIAEPEIEAETGVTVEPETTVAPEVETTVEPTTAVNTVAETEPTPEAA